MESLSRQGALGLLNKVKQLSGDDLHESAVLLGSFVVSLCEEGHAKAHAKFAFGNALRTSGQHKRAGQAYQDALHEMNKVSPQSPLEWFLPGESEEPRDNEQHIGEDAMAVENDASGFEEEDISERLPLSEKKRRRKSFSPALSATQFSRFAGRIKFRLAQCFVSSGNKESAVSTLESVSRESLPSAAIALLGKLKRDSNSKGALDVLKEALQREPYVMEIALLLFDLEVDAEVVLSLMQSPNERISQWFEQLIRAHGAASSHRPKEAVQRFAQLAAQVLPGNAHVLIQLARGEQQCGHRDAAVHWFERSHALDPHNLDATDEFAGSLKQVPDRPRLVQLTHELLGSSKSSSNRPEPWVAAAHLCHAQNDLKKALDYATRACEIAPRHVPALHLKGTLLLTRDNALASLSSFAHALQIRRDFEGLRGLAEAYLVMDPPKWADALQVAKEAVSLMPHDARAFVLLARALAAQPSTEKLAAEALLRALRIDAHNVMASSLLADVRMNQHRRGDCDRNALLEAASVLTRLLQIKALPRDQLYCKIGKLFAAAGDRGRALENFHDALSLNPNSKDAQEELEGLEEPRRGTSAEPKSYGTHHISPTSLRRSPARGVTRSHVSPTSPDVGPVASMSPQGARGARRGGGTWRS